MTKNIAVIIPTYNYGRFIGEAIESVLAQTLPADECVVVDDGSSDDTEAVVGQYRGRVRYVKQLNAGVCAARNRGVAESSSELIAFLDADDIWEPTKLEKQAALFEADHEIGLVHCGMREFDSATRATMGINVNGAETDLWQALLLWEGPGAIGPGGTIMVSRRAFTTVGGFDTRLKVGEDWDFCYRVVRLFRAGFVPEPLVNYRSHAAGAHLNVREMERGMGLFYEKAFSEGDMSVTRLRRRAIGNYHRVLAGSYFQAGEYSDFIRNSVKSVWTRPANIRYFLEFPLRKLRRRD